MAEHEGGRAGARPRRRLTLAGAAGAAGAGLLAVSWWASQPGPQPSPGGDEDADLRQAAALAGVRPADIQPSTGGLHVVYHAATGLPAPERPRADGRLTLVWFGAPW